MLRSCLEKCRADGLRSITNSPKPEQGKMPGARQAAGAEPTAVSPGQERRNCLGNSELSGRHHGPAIIRELCPQRQQGVVTGNPVLGRYTSCAL